MWGPGSCSCFSTSALCCPEGVWGAGIWSQAPGAPSGWAFGLSTPSCPCSSASTCAVWAGWPTARLPTQSSSLRQTVVVGRWASSAWASGRTTQSAGTPTATASKVQRPRPQPLKPCPTCPGSAHSHSPTQLPVSQMWPAVAAKALWVMGLAPAMGSCSTCWLPLPTSPPSMGWAGARPQG